MGHSQAAYSDLVLGIDGGGSHTVAFLAERQAEGRVLGRGTGGPSNTQAVSLDRAFQALDDAVSQSFRDAGLTRAPVGAAAFGMAGVDSDQAAAVIQHWAESVRLAERVNVENDATLLIAGGTPEGWGLGVVCGTGSIAFGRTAHGRMDRSGGWGFLLGDEGSAYGLALAGMRAVARSSDGCLPPTSLTAAVLAFMSLQEPLQMIHAVYRGDWDRARLATIAPLVLKAAEDGDAVARGIVEREAMDLARTTAAAARKLNLPQRVPLAITGGALLKGAQYRQLYLEALQAQGVSPEPITLVHEPAAGAVRVARRLASQA